MFKSIVPRSILSKRLNLFATNLSSQSRQLIDHYFDLISLFPSDHLGKYLRQGARNYTRCCNYLQNYNAPKMLKKKKKTPDQSYIVYLKLKVI